MPSNQLPERYIDRFALRASADQLLGFMEHLVIDLDVRPHTPHGTHRDVHFGRQEAHVRSDLVMCRAWVDLHFVHGPAQLVALRRADDRWRISSPAFVSTRKCPPTALPCRPGSNVLTLDTIETGELTFIPPAVRRNGGRDLREYEAGANVAVRSGCLACHGIGEDGNRKPGPALTRVGSALDERQLRSAVIDAREPMPSFDHLPRAKLAALVRFLALLR